MEAAETPPGDSPAMRQKEGAILSEEAEGGKSATLDLERPSHGNEKDEAFSGSSDSAAANEAREGKNKAIAAAHSYDEYNVPTNDDGESSSHVWPESCGDGMGCIRPPEKQDCVPGRNQRSSSSSNGAPEAPVDSDFASDPLSPFARARTCTSDVFIGFQADDCPPGGSRRHLLRFVKWFRAELEMQGFSCSAFDRRRCRDARAHAIARAAMDAAFGVVIVCPRTFANPYAMEELRWFLEQKSLLPVFFGLAQGDCIAGDIIQRRGKLWEQFGGALWEQYGGIEGEWMEVVNALSRAGVKLEVCSGNCRDTILDAIEILGKGLGRRGAVDKAKAWRSMGAQELPFPRNGGFIGRKEELIDLEMLLFGDAETDPKEYIEIQTCSNQPRKDLFIGKKSSSRRSKSNSTSAAMWKESKNEIELEGDWSSTRPNWYVKKNNTKKLSYGRGVACVCGKSGIGKTELLLEFAYRFAQNYKMVLWVGGEERYLRQNYMNLLPLLGVDVNVGNELSLQRNGWRSFDDMEAEAITKVRRELMRDIPFLLVIDGLEQEKDWWDGRNILELLPRFGGVTHIIISTCLPRILDMEPLCLHGLSGPEGMSLMKRNLGDLESEDTDALRVIEERLDRLPLGLAIVGSLLSHLPMTPCKLLDSINRMPHKELVGVSNEELMFKRNPFLFRLLDFCISMLDDMEKPSRLGTRIIETSCWFAPSLVPISLITLAASHSNGECHNTKFWKKCLHMMSCTCMKPSVSFPHVESLLMLVKFVLARSCMKVGYITFPNIVKAYARTRSNVGVATSVVRAISAQGTTLLHINHIWAACFLTFKFGMDSVVVKLSIHDTLSFIRRFVLPLASLTFATHCNAAMELLRVSTEALEVLEDSLFFGKRNYQSSCLIIPKILSPIDVAPLPYTDIGSLKATLLETRAKFMLQGGKYDIGEQLCRSAINIKEVIYGWGHPETQSTCEIMEELIRLQAKF